MSKAPWHEVIDLTPDLARDFLGKNTHNRSYSPNVAVGYADDMTAGRWRFTGDSLRVDVNGVLIDGQHRCGAVILSGCTIKIGVWWDLEPETQSVMDLGKRRNPHDFLRLRGVANGSSIGTMARLDMRWKAGARGANLFTGGNQAVLRERGITTTAIVEYAYANRHELELAMSMGFGPYKRAQMTPSVAYFSALLFHRVHHEDAARFLHHLASGAELEADSPILQLRNRIASGRVSGETTGGAPGYGVQLELTIRAWNLWRKGRTVKRLQVSRRDSEDGFPEPE